ncbi:MAG: family 16 glycoside hydrolase [Pyrinomonadaceae bacterium]
MNKLAVIVSTCFLGLLAIIGCSMPNGLSGTEANTVGPEIPAPVQQPGKSFSYNFDTDTTGRLPAKFHAALTGKGTAGAWEVKADSSAPSQPNVLAQTSSDRTSYRFPLAIADEGSFRNLDLSVRFKPISGQVDQAGGLVWRFKDANNYYIVRANALENNVVLYKVENGKRTDLPLKGEGRTYGKKASVPSAQWNELRVVAAGNLFEIFVNGQKLYEVEDNTFTEAGKVGLWTKADSVTYFDDLRVTAK